jgi:3-oxoadipate enol-lactonase
MWHAVAPAFDGARLHELRGYGDTPAATEPFSHAADLASTLSEPSVLVGASFGGQVCLEVAATRPELVTDLVLLCAALPDHEWSPEMEAYGAREEALWEADDLDAVTALNVDFWVGDATADVRELVSTMQRRSLDLQRDADAESDTPESIDLGAISARTLVAWGDRDHADFAAIGARLGREIAGAETAVIEGAGHLPALEQPDAAIALVKRFLAL